MDLIYFIIILKKNPHSNKCPPPWFETETHKHVDLLYLIIKDYM